ncbi:MAG TPA: NAD(P)/FAD-dependent oxidoreductase [Blastocatellia bacterium]
MEPAKIAVIGAGPGGAHFASLAAAAGYRVLLFDPKGAWEKPCGGGVTSRGLKEYPFLTESQIHPYKSIDHLTVVSSEGRRVSVDLNYSFAVYSRAVLNDLIVKRAEAAGARFIREKIIGFERSSDGWALKDGSGGSWQTRLLVGADGAASSTRRHLIGILPAQDIALAMGYNAFCRSEGVSGRLRRPKRGPDQSNTVVVQFLKNFSGYLWAFPRLNCINFGIASKLREQTSSALRTTLDDFVSGHLNDSGLSAERSDFFAAKIPVLDRGSWKDLKVSGDGWALIGDAAGFVDPITGEGIYYALKSADLLFSSLPKDGSAGPVGEVTDTDAGREALDSARFSASYEALWRRTFGQELERASKLLRRFYGSRFMGRDFNDAMVLLARYHPGIRNTMTRAIVGEQSYVSLKRDLVRSLFRPF